MNYYNQLGTTKAYTNFMKEIFFPSAKLPEEINLPKMRFLVFEGQGSPGSDDFQKAIQSLYGMAFTLKMGLKFGKIEKPDGYFDFKVPPLEGLWWQAGQPFDMNDK